MHTWDLLGLRPKSVLIPGSFDFAVVAAKASLDCSTAAPSGSIDSVFEATNTGTAGNSITLQLVGDSPGTKASYTFSTANCSNKLEYASVGTAGNAWKVSMSGTESVFAEDVSVDSTAKHIFIEYRDGITTDTEIASAVNAASLLIDDSSPITFDQALSASQDYVVGESFSGGVENHYVEVSGNAVTVHYTPGTTTVGDVETLIGALSGDDDIIGVKTAGTGATGATVLQAGDAFGPTALSGGLAAGACTNVVGEAFTVARQSTGVYRVTLANGWTRCVEASAEIQGVTNLRAFTGAYNTSSRTIDITVVDPSTGTVTDVTPASGKKLMFTLWMDN